MYNLFKDKEFSIKNEVIFEIELISKFEYCINIFLSIKYIEIIDIIKINKEIDNNLIENENISFEANDVT